MLQETLLDIGRQFEDLLGPRRDEFGPLMIHSVMVVLRDVFNGNLADAQRLLGDIDGLAHGILLLLLLLEVLLVRLGRCLRQHFDVLEAQIAVNRSVTVVLRLLSSFLQSTLTRQEVCRVHPNFAAGSHSVMAAVLLVLHLFIRHHGLVLVALPQVRILHAATLHVGVLLVGRDALLRVLLDDCALRLVTDQDHVLVLQVTLEERLLSSVELLHVVLVRAIRLDCVARTLRRLLLDDNVALRFETLLLRGTTAVDHRLVL